MGTAAKQNKTPYDVATRATVAQLHAAFMAGMQKRAAEACRIAGRAHDAALVAAGVEVLLHAARMRVDYTVDRLAGVLRAAETGAARAKITQEAAARERALSEKFGAAEVPAAMQALCDAAAAARADDPRIEKIFAGEDRLYLAIRAGMSPVEKKVAAALRRMPGPRGEKRGGYRIVDWSAGRATDSAGKQEFRIGRLLREHAPALLPAFENRTTDNLMVVISRRPDDIVRASVNRAWHSCAGPGDRGAFRMMPDSIRAGRMIAYLISSRDPDINNPLARRMIEPFERSCARDTRLDRIGAALGRVFARAAGRDAGEPAPRIWHPGPNYGIRNPDFDAVVKSFVDGSLNTGGRGHYFLCREIYADGARRVERRRGATSSRARY
jgi:hypothetical protein